MTGIKFSEKWLQNSEGQSLSYERQFKEERSEWLVSNSRDQIASDQVGGSACGAFGVLVKNKLLSREVCTAVEASRTWPFSHSAGKSLSRGCYCIYFHLVSD